MIKFDVLNRWTAKVQFTAEIECSPGDLPSVKLGLAAIWAYKTGASLDGACLDGASLDGARLDGACLDGASLDGASLVRASLVRANLDGASLDGASLVRANLVRANLDGASLVRASLDGASLDGASLVRANLVRARLDGARLDGARLDGASLDGARLDGACLDGARLDGASLDGARLDGARLPAFNIPQEGSLIVWKKLANGRLAKLQIPETAARTATPIGRKCRAEFVEVLQIFEPNGTPCEQGIAQHDGTPYRVGQIVRPDSFDNDIRVECTHGIHFFLTKEEAEAY